MSEPGLNRIHFYSPYFSLREFECRGRGSDHCGCGGAVLIDSRFFDRLIIFRRLLDRPMRLNRGYSCRAWNAKIGGAEHSKHLRGLAIDWDVYSAGYTEREAALAAKQSGLFTGIGVYGQSYRNGGGEIILKCGYKGLRGMVHLEYCPAEDNRPLSERDTPGEVQLFRQWGDLHG